MSLITWIVLGLVSGFIASRLVPQSGGGTIFDVVLGIVGAVFGGFLFNMFGAAGVSGFNAWSILVAVSGAVAVLVIRHVVFGRGSARVR
ncbi:MAG: GlsB/YeaQ/YmgE family stress response membrane protein [Polyangiaceae bacterium]|nr:GlsB/YeaQ/YmgE family stress response membrane protein [Polyangiaceae bacterium]